MLTRQRASNKSVILRRIFLWLFVLVAVAFFIMVIVVRVSYDYEDGKLVQVDAKESLKQDMIALERSMGKVIPDFLSNWTIVKACVVLVFAVLLVFIQYSEENYAEKSDESLKTTYADIYYEK
jgi:preprotein translocase subunit SecG